MPSEWEGASPGNTPGSGEDRLPPNSEEAERGVLGCIMLAPLESLTECAVRLKAGAKVFYDHRYQKIYEAMVDMFNDSPPRHIDTITLAQELKDLLIFDKVGGYELLSSLSDATPSATNLPHYLDIIIEKHTLRRMRLACYSAMQKIDAEPGEVSALMVQVEKDLTSIISDSQNVDTLYKADSLLDGVEQAIIKFQSNPGTLDGLSTGLLDVDKITQGLRAPEVTIIAARPSCGKTSIGLNIAEHNAIANGIPVGFFSLEMGAPSLAFRLVLGRSKVSMGKAKAGGLTEEDMGRLATSQTEIQGAPLFIDEEGGLSLMQLKAKARRMVGLYGLKLLVIDYLQLIHVPTTKYQNREGEIRLISAGIKGLAKELGIPIIVMAQLNRDLERGGNRKPRMSDLRESGAIEQDADIIMALWRGKGSPEPEDNDGTQKFAEVIECAVLKNRNGPTGDCRLTFIRPWTQFQNLMQ